MKVIITIPAYNEEKTLAKTILEIRSVMDKTDYDYKIHVQDDGSSDDTARIAKKYANYFSVNPYNMGLAETFQREIVNCLKLKADVIVHTDADGQYDPSSIPLMIKKVTQGYDLVIGSRFLGKNRYKGSVFKNMGNVVFSWTLSSMLKAKLSDTTSGFRAFNSKVAEGTKIINQFTYTQEQIIRAVKEKFKIAEVPVNVRKTRSSRLFKNSFDYALKAWINIFRIYRDYDPIKFFGKIGFCLFSLGFLLGLYITYTIIRYDTAGGVPRVVLSMLLITTGLQVVLFGFLADMMRR
jgi:glycosyltransferase involved in cell wall biosynthesis